MGAPLAVFIQKRFGEWNVWDQENYDTSPKAPGYAANRVDRFNTLAAAAESAVKMAAIKTGIIYWLPEVGENSVYADIKDRSFTCPFCGKVVGWIKRKVER